MKNVRCFFCSLICAGFFIFCLGNEVTIRSTGGWIRDSDGFSLDYGNAPGGAVYLTQHVEPHTIYRISWEVERTSSQTPAPVLFVETARKHYVQFDGKHRVHYWNSGNETNLKLRFDIHGGRPGRVRISKLLITKVAEKELSRNLIENGDMEQGDVTDFWQSQYPGIIPDFASTATSTDFFCGNRCLRLKFSAAKPQYSIRSAFMPVIPGEKFVLTFWSKGNCDTTLGVSIDCASPTNIYRGKHPYKFSTVKLTTEWNEYRIEYLIPDDLATYPSLADGVARIYLLHQGKGTIELDHFEFHRISEPQVP